MDKASVAFEILALNGSLGSALRLGLFVINDFLGTGPLLFDLWGFFGFFIDQIFKNGCTRC